MKDVDQQAVAAFIAKWRNTPGGAERANYVLFLTGLCNALGLEEPEAGRAGVLGRYQFDGPISGGSLKTGGPGFADFYRKGSFVLEAKQSQIPEGQRDQPELFDLGAQPTHAPAGASYDRLMRRALVQAKNYAVNLPADHPWPPFLIVCDVGRAFELYFDWAGNGRGYDFFPDRQGYRITIDRLAEPEVQNLFRDIWNEPRARDPRLRAAEVTRQVARRLAEVSKWLEETQRIKTQTLSDRERSLAVEETSLFLMRILFCMFAEDIGLLPPDSFKNFLADAVEDERHFENGLHDLWAKMADANIRPRYSWVVREDVRHFNGGLFENTKTYTLGKSMIGELLVAAKAQWASVEPAIFGTLLEQALSTTQRAQLGAHYTPRPYVERLVRATIMEVLEADWEAVQRDVEAATGEGRGEDALRAATAFHARLCEMRVLDPACGTGNFLYVSMELLLRLEADVLVLIEQLDGEASPRVGPQQFYGLELNPRAAVIAELVLWIGWLRWRTRNDPDAVPEPVLRKTDTINFGRHGGYDAVLRQRATGEPDFEHPVLAEWPDADFIVGNPPFIGKGSVMRKALGDDYVEAVWRANPRVPKSADFVMQWWDRAAHILAARPTPLTRFGFVTTNSISQSFSRKVIDRHLNGDGMSLLFAIPDHPWTKASKDAAAVRIAMTVVGGGVQTGQLVEIVDEQGLETDDPRLQERCSIGRINPDISLGTDLTTSVPMTANQGLSCNGMMLAGQGFKISKSLADRLVREDGDAARAVVRQHIGGSELVQRWLGEYVIDFAHHTEQEARRLFPACYQHVLATVKPGRDSNRRPALKRRWWVFAEPRFTFRPALTGLDRYIATTRTSKHRLFQFVPSDLVPNHEVVAIALNDGFSLGVLSSRIHLVWALMSGGTLEDRPRYNKARCFDQFPFPDANAAQQARIAELAEELDITRKVVLSEVSGLTMTELYNLRDKLRSGATMDLSQQDRARTARAGIVNRLHEQLDEAVAAAYGWPADLAPAEIVTRLVALNAERAAEEAAGTVRWLRPDYQRPRFGAEEA